MRVPVGKTVKVGPGDHVIVRGRLPDNSRLGRLYVFAAEDGGSFAPYVQNLSLMPEKDKPAMLSPMSMRLVEKVPMREISFVADIHGRIRVMQEVDTEADPRMKVEMVRKINPQLPFLQRLGRRLSGIFA